MFPTTPIIRGVGFWGDKVSEIRAFSVADQRQWPGIDTSAVRIHPCRGLVLSTGVRAGGRTRQ